MQHQLRLTKSEKSKREWERIGITALILVVAILVGIALSRFSLPQAGQAIYIGDTPWAGGVINLVQEKTITFTALPEQERELQFAAPISLYDRAPHNYTFTLSKRDDTTYAFHLQDNNNATIDMTDILQAGGSTDRTFLHLNDDPVPDLEVKIENNQITLTNLHSVPPDQATIKVTTTNGTALPSIIRLRPGEQFTALINASSSSIPLIRSNVGTLTVVEENARYNYTVVRLSYTAPQTSAAQTLDIAAVVAGRETHVQYTLAIGNIVYALQEPNYPRMILQLTQGNTGRLNITFSNTRELQALGLPCDVEQPLRTIFQNQPVKRVYSFYNNASKVWNPAADEASDFVVFSRFTGYFVELREPQAITVSATCTVKNLQPLPAIPGFGGSRVQRHVLAKGWNLFSLPGILPQPLTDFTTVPASAAASFKIYECRQGYQCTEIERTAPLHPGKPYWIQTNEPLILQYLLE